MNLVFYTILWSLSRRFTTVSGRLVDARKDNHTANGCRHTRYLMQEDERENRIAERCAEEGALTTFDSRYFNAQFITV